MGLADRYRKRVWIPDVESPADLRAVAREAHRRGLRRAAGSAGFAAALAGPWKRKGRAPLQGPGPTWWAVIAGSAHPRTREQIAYLKKRLNGNKTTCRGVVLSSSLERGNPHAVGRVLLKKALRLQSLGRRPRWIATGGETAFGLVRG